MRECFHASSGILSYIGRMPASRSFSAFLVLHVPASVDLSHRLSLELDTVGGMSDTVTDRIGDRLISDGLMPAIDRDLADHDGGLPAMTVFEDLQQAQPSGPVKAFEPEIIQDDHLLFAQPREFLQIATVTPAQPQVLEQRGAPIVAGLVAVQTALVAQRAGKKTLPIMESFP